MVKTGENFNMFTNKWTQFNVPVWTKYLKHLKGKPNLRFMEIGTYEGQSAVWFLENILTHKGSSITIIDPFYYPNKDNNKVKHFTIKNRFLDNVKKYESKIVFYQQFSWDTLIEIHKWEMGGDPELDCIYIDGSHLAKDVLEDAVLSFRLLKVGGLMIFDDYLWDVKRGPTGKPKIAVDAFLSVYADKIKILYNDYQVIIKRIK